MGNGHVDETPKLVQKTRQAAYTLISGSLSVGLIVSILDFFVNPQPTPPPVYPVWLMTLAIAGGGLVLIGFAEAGYRIWNSRYVRPK